MKTLRIALVTVLLVIFVGVGVGKLLAPQHFVAQFEAFGLPYWFIYVTGCVELSGAAMLLKKQTRTLGAVVLTITMFVASTLHLWFESSLQAAPAMLLFCAVSALAYLNRKAKVEQL